jgi:DNA-binding NarL/FixJ family response regulator
MERIRVVIADDQPIVRDGLKMILSLFGDIEVVATAVNGEEALKECEALRPDVVLMDIRMPVMDGVRATQLIRQKLPGTKVVILTTFNDDEFIFEALKNGAGSYLLKDVASEDIVNTIRIIHMGGTVLHNSVASKVMGKLSGNEGAESSNIPLTQREIEISKLVAEGLSNRDIAARLFITEGTVKNHITNVLSKLNLDHRTQIALYVIENKL